MPKEEDFSRSSVLPLSVPAQSKCEGGRRTQSTELCCDLLLNHGLALVLALSQPQEQPQPYHGPQLRLSKRLSRAGRGLQPISFHFHF